MTDQDGEIDPAQCAFECRRGVPVNRVVNEIAAEKSARSDRRRAHRNAMGALLAFLDEDNPKGQKGCAGGVTGGIEMRKPAERPCFDVFEVEEVDEPDQPKANDGTEPDVNRDEKAVGHGAVELKTAVEGLRLVSYDEIEGDELLDPVD